MTKGAALLLTLLMAAWISFAGGDPKAGKEPLIQGKPLAYWLKELKDPDPLAREEALVVLAGAGEAARGAIPALTELLKDKSAPIRVKAALALGQLKGQTKDAAPVLLEAWKDGSRTLRHQILPALGPLALESEEVLLLLLRASGDIDERTRVLATDGIRKTGPAAAGPLAKALGHTDPLVRRQALVHLGHLGTLATDAIPALTRMLKDDDWETRFEAAQALWKIDRNSRAILDVMIEASSKQDQGTRLLGMALLVQVKPPVKEALPAYRAALKGETPFIRVQAAEAVWLITRQADEVVPIYREIIENASPATDPAVRHALFGIKQLGPEAKPLRATLLDSLRLGKDAYLMQYAPAVLAKLGPESIPTLVDMAGRVNSTAEQARSRAAFQTLGLMGKDGLKPLLALIENESSQVRTGAFGALQLAGADAKGAVPALRKALKHDKSAERTAAIWVLARIGPDAKDALPDLLDVARKDKEPNTRRYALAALPHLQPAREDALALLNDALNDPYPLMRLTAADWLWHLDPMDPRPAKVAADVVKDPTCLHHALKMLGRRRAAAAPAVPAVVDLLNGKNAFYRMFAIQALDQMGVAKEHQQKLVAALSDPDGGVRTAAALALRRARLEEKAAVAALANGLPKLPEYQRAPAFAALVEFGPAAKDAIPALETMIPAVGSPVVRVPIIEIMAAIDPATLAKWQPTLDDAFTKFGSMPAARLLAEHDPKEQKYVAFLIDKLQDPAYFNRQTAALNLGKGGAWTRPALPALRRALEDPHPGVRVQAALALEKLEPGKNKVVPVLITVLREGEEPGVKFQAANALATLGPAARDAVPALRAAVRDADSNVRFAANEALWQIDPQSAIPCVFQGY